MNVLFITRKWPPAVGGMETYSVELCSGLAGKAHLRRDVLPGRSDGSSPSGIALVAFGVKVAWRLLTSGERFDVVHGGDMAIWPLVRLAGVRCPGLRLVLSAHGTDVAFGARRGLRARAYALYLRLGARLLPGVVVVANSRATAALARGFGYGNVIVVPLAARIPPGDAPPQPVEPYVLFVGRLIPRKGCGWFIREVLPKLPKDIRMKVAGTIGDPSEREALQNERVDFLGPVFGEELARLRREAIAVIVPNLATGPESFEGFGLTAVEAAADGGLVIAARVDGVEDAVRDELTGFLEEAGDADAWAERIMAVRNWTASQRTTFIDGAQSAVATHYSWDRVARDTLAVYEADIGA